MGDKPTPTILVIVGITGDLSKRKLLPAIEQIVRAGAAPGPLHVIGITRQDISVTGVLDGIDGTTEFLQKHLEMYQMDLVSRKDYEKLKKHIAALEKKLGGDAQVLYYLSVPPQISQPIIELLGQVGMGKNPSTKLLLEKPFGTDYTSAKELIEQIKGCFAEEQVYRIDHYLAKEMAQNLIVFRQSNSLFKRTWDKEFIESIDIIASETIGIEGRAAFYEQTGALRDIVQSHLLQLAALTLAHLPEGSSIPRQRHKALQQLLSPQDPVSVAVRGQYKGYRLEVDNPDSMVETFVALTLYSRDPRWQGVPIRLITGKSLDKKTTEIRIRYRQENVDEANMLVLHIQPDEGVEVDMWAKEPGYDRKLQKLRLAFSYSHHFTSLPEAYERVFVDAMRSDHSLFTTSDEVLETWRIVQPVQRVWEMGNEPLILYEPGTMPEL